MYKMYQQYFKLIDVNTFLIVQRIIVSGEIIFWYDFYYES